MVLLKNLLIPTLSSSLISLFAEVLDSPVELKIGAFGFACSIFHLSALGDIANQMIH
jgi:hypothetical protein